MLTIRNLYKNLDKLPGRSLILLFCLLIISSVADAQQIEKNALPMASATIPDGMPVTRVYGTKDFNAESGTWAITQDNRGIMYFGSESGVLEYDGVRWNLITLPTNRLVRAMATDNKGVVLIGSIGEFGHLASDSTGKTIYISLSEQLDEKHRKFGNVWSIHATTHGDYFVTDNYIFHWKDKNLIAKELPNRNWGFTVYDDVFLYYRNGGLARLRNGEIEPLPYTEQFSAVTSGRITILPFGKGKLLISTTFRGSYIYHLDRLNDQSPVTPSILEPFATEADPYFSSHRLYYFADHIGTEKYIFAMVDGAIVIMNADGTLDRVFDKFNGQDAQGVSDVYIDQHKNLWATTFKGILHIELSTPWTIYDVSETVNSPIILPTVHNGILYVSTYKGISALKINPPSAKGDQQIFVDVDTPNEQSFAMLSDQGVLYASIQNKVFTVEGIKSNKIYEIEGNPLILSLIVSRRFPNHLFIGTYSEGLKAIQLTKTGQGIKTQPVNLDIAEFKAESIRFMREDKLGNLWITTEISGTYQLEFQSNDINDFTVLHYNEKNGLPVHISNSFSAVKGEILAATTKGIYRAQRSAETNKVHFTPDKNLSQFFNNDDSTVGFISELGDNFLIGEIPSYIAILQHQNNDEYFVNESPFKALPESRGAAGTIHIDDKQNIWIPVDSTLYRYMPEVKKDFKQHYSAYIRKVDTLGNQTLFNGNFFQNKLSEKETYSTNIQPEQAKWSYPNLEYISNTISFEYSATFYEQSARLKFSYKLEGFDTDWSPYTADTKKEYTNLPEGDYTFHVKAKNIYDTESSIGNYHFTILPPWYRTVAAYFIYLLAFLLVAYFSIEMYTRRLRKSKIELEKIVRLRTQELENSLRELKTTQHMLTEASHKAGMADIARNVMHTIGNALNGINVSIFMINKKYNHDAVISKLNKTSHIIAENKSPEKIGKLPDYINAITNGLKSSDLEIKDEIIQLQNRTKQIETILAGQKEYIQAGAFTQQVELSDLINDALEKSAISADKDNITIEKYIEKFPPIIIEKHKVVSILTNLIDNSKISMRNSSKTHKILTIAATSTESKQLSIKIADNGVGIKSENLKEIFTYGYSFDGNKKSNGLHECAIESTQMGGKLTADSKGLEFGSEFILELPLNYAQTVAEKPISHEL